MLTFLFVLVLVGVTIYALGCWAEFHDYEQVLTPSGRIITRIRKPRAR